MVHSGPFNGLCEIESSRGSPGISNIFLLMLQLLRPLLCLSPPLVSYPLPQTLAHLSLFPLTLPTKTTHPHRSSSSRSCAGISQLPVEDSQWMRADFRISVTEKAQMDTRTRRCEFFRPRTIYSSPSVADARKKLMAICTYYTEKNVLMILTRNV